MKSDSISQSLNYAEIHICLRGLPPKQVGKTSPRTFHILDLGVYIFHFLWTASAGMIGTSSHPQHIPYAAQDSNSTPYFSFYLLFILKIFIC